jgi:hypothetical protein
MSFLFLTIQSSRDPQNNTRKAVTVFGSSGHQDGCESQRSVANFVGVKTKARKSRENGNRTGDFLFSIGRGISADGIILSL